ncbi:chaperone protein DnaJ 2-like [Anopheles maculipalpis]|uniref:chaperone protein DnaJ 2-like n=1 Tax=Anopheles maculipalpis TaxID=1496333 RepID=UPI0021595978|nr:chaperone protein DnaJ 2-like [Anopheles maculipalpis]
MLPNNHYEILGVPEDAPISVILAAYRRLAPMCHPNFTEYDPDTFPVKRLTQSQYWLAVNEAIEVLYNPELRCLYNLGIHKDGYPNYVFSGKCVELFQAHTNKHNHHFMIVLNGKLWTTQSIPVQHLEASVTLEEIFFGMQKTINYQRMRYIDGRSITQQASLVVPIQQYTRHGTCIMLKGYGHETELGQGDVMVKLHLAPHKVFTVVGNDLVCDMPVPLSTAMFGGIVQVQTIDSKTLTIYINPTVLLAHPPRIFFKGEGLHTPTGRGDMFVFFTATIPTVAAHLYQDAWRIIREIEAYNNVAPLDKQ